jgi:uncharacterized protein (DUF2141 family)
VTAHYFALVLGACIATATVAKSAELRVTITDLRSQKGDVHIAIYDNPGGFPKGDGMREELRSPVNDGRALAIFKDLAPGQYAIATFHDENDNDEFDQGFLGIPLEDFAFSSGAKAFLGPPSFKDAAFSLDGDTSLTISLGN